MSGFLEVCFVTVQVTLGSWQFWRYTIQVQHSKKKKSARFSGFSLRCVSTKYLLVASGKYARNGNQHGIIHIYIHTGVYEYINVDTHWKNAVARATLCQHTLFPHLLQCEAWAIHADNTNCQRTRGKNLKAHQLEPYTALKFSRPKLVPEKAKNHTYPSHMSQ